MKKNNFNCNCNGVSVEFLAGYDSGISQMYFDENFIIDKRNNRYTETLIFTGCEFKKEDFKITVIEDDNNRKNALLYGCLSAEYFEDYATIDVINEAFEDYVTIYDLLRAYDEAGVKYDVNFHTITTHGYSQGDCIDVYVLNDLNGWEITETELKKHISQLCWDAPVSARLTVNEDEFFEDDILGDDYYVWDYFITLENITKTLHNKGYSANDIKEVIAVIPSDIDYF